MTELHASLGLINIPMVQDVMKRRKAIYTLYRSLLSDRVEYQDFNEDSYNYSYMPILLRSEAELLKVVAHLNASNIFPRRYFYPSLNTIDAVKQYTPCPVSEDIASRILALPSYHELTDGEVEGICESLVECL